jgi:translation initiation factor IF-2
VNESDIQLASISQGIVVGFNVRADNQAREMAELRGVGIRTYSIIYELLDDIKAALYGMLEPTYEEKWLGSATVRDTFRITKVGMVAGLMVDKGSLQRHAIVRLFREDLQVYEGRLDTLKRFKDDVKEVANGFECGASLENFHDIHVGDVLEVFEKIEVAPAQL